MYVHGGGGGGGGGWRGGGRVVVVVVVVKGYPEFCLLYRLGLFLLV